MIKLEYDINTSGTRVSFVIKDEDGSKQAVADASHALCCARDSDGDVIQNKENLRLLASIIEQLRESMGSNGRRDPKTGDKWKCPKCHWYLNTNGMCPQGCGSGRPTLECCWRNLT